MLKGLDDSLLPASLVATHSSPLDCFHSLSADLLGRDPTALVSRTSWSLQHILGFTQWLLGASTQRHPPPNTLLASVSLFNLGGRFHDTFTRVTFITVKLPPRGPHCHRWLPTWDGAGPLTVTFADVVICWCFLGIENSLNLFFPQSRSLCGWGLTLRMCLPLFQFQSGLPSSPYHFQHGLWLQH